MNGLRLEKIGDDKVRLSGIDWVSAACLLEVPKIVPQAKSGRARDRLFPTPTAGDEKVNEDWQQFVVPELERLFASAGEILAKDIEPLEVAKDPLKERELTIPLSHCDAWMSAINQSRLILGAQHDITEKNMDETEFSDPNSPKQQAVLRIHVLGYILQQFVEFVSGL